MSELLLYPRLPAAVARSRLALIRRRTLAQLECLAATQDPDAIYAATGGTRVTPDVLQSLRIKLLGEARLCGFPQRSGKDAVQFDWAAAPLLLDVLRLSSGEACRNEVWSFIAIIVLPDLVTWRFPSQNEERFLGGERNTFQRMWWRAYLLREPGATDPWRLIRLPEDALVGLMERPGISSNPRVTRAIAVAIMDLIATLPSEKREAGWRLAYKLVRRRIPLVNLDALDPRELTAQLNEICRAVAARLEREHVAA